MSREERIKKEQNFPYANFQNRKNLYERLAAACEKDKRDMLWKIMDPWKFYSSKNILWVYYMYTNLALLFLTQIYNRYVVFNILFDSSNIISYLLFKKLQS